MFTHFHSHMQLYSSSSMTANVNAKMWIDDGYVSVLVFVFFFFSGLFFSIDINHSEAPSRCLLLTRIRF